MFITSKLNGWKKNQADNKKYQNDIKKYMNIISMCAC